MPGRCALSWAIILVLSLSGISGCGFPRLPEKKHEVQLQEFARSDRRWTGVAVSQSGRVFVAYPRWSEDTPISVGELLLSGEVVPFPDPEWNRWNPGLSPANHLVCAQSVVVDSEDFLWVLDPANPQFQGVVYGGAKLLRVDLSTHEVVRRILFDESVALPASYLNDVRIDNRHGYAYLTDSGTGALVVVELASGKAWRRLANHRSTQSENLSLTIGDRPWLRGGKPPRVHADGIALDRAGDYVYYQALTGRTLYRIPASLLRDPNVSEEQTAKGVERVGVICAADGIEFGRDEKLYLTDIEGSGIRVYEPGKGKRILIRDKVLSWPDSIAVAPDGSLVVSTSQIHLGDHPSGPYRLFRIKP
ncbi:MAG TPA: L-dopachrome tautomerase-related protein [Syntrophobacteraceae bacterium]|nr:L-dopachrome tautomerase-related protein [Syntrophobacteraceae bacterium]